MVQSPLNPAASQSDIEHVIQLLRPSHIFVQASKLDLVSNAIRASKSEGMKLITVFGTSEGLLQVRLYIRTVLPRLSIRINTTSSSLRIF